MSAGRKALGETDELRARTLARLAPHLGAWQRSTAACEERHKAHALLVHRSQLSAQAPESRPAPRAPLAHDREDHQGSSRQLETAVAQHQPDEKRCKEASRGRARKGWCCLRVVWGVTD